MVYLPASDLYATPIGGGLLLACGVGFPMRVVRLPRSFMAPPGPMPCGIDGRYVVPPVGETR